MAKTFEDFTRLYPLSKTLRFEARPVGATLRNFLASGILEEDEHRAESYVKVKKLIDEYHKAFIDKVLSNYWLKIEDEGKRNSLREYYALYSTGKRDGNSRESLKNVQQSLREGIAKALAEDPAYSRLFAKDLLESYKDKKDKKVVHEADLVQFINQATSDQLAPLSKDEALGLVSEFKGFTTYFGGFHDNRRNMYSAEEKPTAIAYRLINENLPKFIDNMQSFAKIAEVPELQADLELLYAEFHNELNASSISNLFQLNYYNEVLTQKGIDLYNAIIGGRTKEGQQAKAKGINEYVNLYNQQHKEAKLPKLKVLFKQILSDRSALSWLPEEFHNDNEVLNAIKDCYERLTVNVLGDKALKNLLRHLEDYNTDGIFLRNDLQLTDISQKMFGSWNVIQDAIMNDIRNTAPARNRKESEEDYEKRLTGIFKKADSFSLHYIDYCLDNFIVNNAYSIENYFATLGAVNTSTIQRENLFAQIENAYTDAHNLLVKEYPAVRNLAQDKDNVSKVKLLLDALNALLHFVKPLLGKGDERDKDERFYGELSALWTELDTVIPLYNMVRNYMSHKPYSEDKIKLNFSNAQLLNGWDANKESTNASIILRRNGKYYLAIMNKDYRKQLEKAMPSDGDCYERMVYKQFDITKQLPKCTTETKEVKEAISNGRGLIILDNQKNWNKPLVITKELWDLNNLVWDKKKEIWQKRKKGNETRPKKFQIAYLEQTNDILGYNKAKEDWIAFAKEFLRSYRKTEIYNGIEYKSTYESVIDFYHQLDGELYKISFVDVSVAYIDQLIEEGKMYLFQIYNKDFSEFSKGTPNMHTLYWKALFDERNLADVVYKLNGEAEMFFRKKSINCTHPTHPAGHPIANKNRQNCKKESIFEYDLVKDKRYTVDKFMFHVPITMNFKSRGTSNINPSVLEYLKSANNLHIIGIDRGERHLLYLVVIDMKGHIVEQYSLNEIVNEYNGNSYHTNYHDLLNDREIKRQEARKSWQTIESIKELKEGYLSQVIHKISQLMVKYHAIVVLEDLNIGFMRGRQKVEKQVYQKFEKQLVDKLNYLVDKQTDATELGGLLNAYQLTSKFESFQKMDKESGFLFGSTRISVS